MLWPVSLRLLGAGSGLTLAPSIGRRLAYSIIRGGERRGPEGGAHGCRRDKSADTSLWQVCGGRCLNHRRRGRGGIGMKQFVDILWDTLSLPSDKMAMRQTVSRSTDERIAST